MQLLPPTVITTAATVVGPVVDLKLNQQKLPLNLSCLLKFTYGSGGTNVSVFVQTSFDGGTTWVDVISFTQLLLASAKQVASVNRQANQAPFAATDGSMAQTTAKDGVFGSQWRVKIISTGTYAGNTTLEVDAFGEN